MMRAQKGMGISLCLLSPLSSLVLSPSAEKAHLDNMLFGRNTDNITSLPHSKNTNTSVHLLCVEY